MRDQVVECATLEASQGRDVEELETLAEHLAMSLDRLPHGRVLGVVVDDQDFEVRVIEVGQGIEGLFDHFRRLVVARHVHRDFRSIRRIGLHRQELPAPFVDPHRFGQFMGFGQQYDKDTKRTEGE
ncbi:hypothetical protein D3C76_1402660 [compost metagenome]